MQKITLASNNAGKIKEFTHILPNFTLIPQQEFNTPEANENGLSFVENALIKARNAATYANLPAIADDSGLVIDALNGEPGIYSSRYSGGSDDDNIKKVLRNMQGISHRTARFYCVIVYVQSANDPTPIIATASWEGEILEQTVGEHGFGYDSIFFVPEKNCSSAQLSPQEKNTLSHRGKALQKLQLLLKNIS
jgi:XTP/dITP diphosphohydrolase